MVIYETIDNRGDLHVDLANSISVMIDNAIKGGIKPEEAMQTAAFVCADYARTTFGEDSLALLAKVLTERADAPAPSFCLHAIN